MSKFISTGNNFSKVDMGKSFEKAKVMFELYSHLDTTPVTVLGIALKTAIRNRTPTDKIIETIKDFTEDNYELSAKIIGKGLLKIILKL